MEEMFGVGDIIIRVKHVRATFRLMNWKLNVENYWVLENTNNVEFVVF
jgi:hypothetical protein